MKAFSILLKLKDSDRFEWRKEHQDVFTQIKVSLTRPSVLMPYQHGKPLKLYISATEESIGSLLAQVSDTSREQAIFYLSRNLNSGEFIWQLKNFALPYSLPHLNSDIICFLPSPKSLPRLISSVICLLGQLSKAKLVSGQQLYSNLVYNTCLKRPSKVRL